MQKAVSLFCLALLSGLTIFAWRLQTSGETEPISVTQMLRADDTAMSEPGMADRIGELERQVAALRNRVELMTGETSTPPTRTAERDGAAPEVKRVKLEENPELDRLLRATRLWTFGGRAEALTEAGFSPSRAKEIDRRIQELRLKAQQVRYEAAREAGAGAVDTSVDEFVDVDPVLRHELGDDDYERYLVSMNRSTGAFVGDVLPSSMAEQAGLQRGDLIVGYDGRRVFHPRELTQLPLDGEPGELVLVDVLREHQRIQLALPRGPLGITVIPYHGTLPD